MTKLLEDAIAKLRELPEAEQDAAAAELMRYLAERNPHLSDEQLAELDRRLAESNPRTLTLAELDERLRRLGV